MTDKSQNRDALCSPESEQKVSREKVDEKEWTAMMVAEGLKIDPQTAEVTFSWGYDFDPYGIDPDLPEEYRQIGRNYFARSPGSDVWVWFGDLPSATCDVLRERIDRGDFGVEVLPFPWNWVHLAQNEAEAFEDAGACAEEIAKKLIRLWEQNKNTYPEDRDEEAELCLIEILRPAVS